MEQDLAWSWRKQWGAKHEPLQGGHGNRTSQPGHMNLEEEASQAPSMAENWMTGRLKLSSTVPRSSRHPVPCTGSSKSHCHGDDLELDLRAVGSGGHLAPSSALCRRGFLAAVPHLFKHPACSSSTREPRVASKPSNAKCKHLPIEAQALQPLLSTGLPSCVSTAEAQVTGDRLPWTLSFWTPASLFCFSAVQWSSRSHGLCISCFL